MMSITKFASFKTVKKQFYILEKKLFKNLTFIIYLNQINFQIDKYITVQINTI